MKKKREGFIAIILFFLIITIAVAVVPIIMQSTSYFAVSETERALFSAESGIRYFIKNKLEPENDWTTIDHTDRIINQDFGDGRFTVGLSDDAGDAGQSTQGRIILKSTGYVTVGTSTFSRTIKYKIKRGADIWENSLYGGSHCKGTTAEPCCDVDDPDCEADNECCEGNITLDFVQNGVIDGDITLKGTFDTPHDNNLEVNGDINEGYDAPVVEVDWPYWETNATVVISEKTDAELTAMDINPVYSSVGSENIVTYEFEGTDYSGTYYVGGTVEQGGVDYEAKNIVLDNNNMVIQGTIVAKGDVSITGGNNIELYPDSGKPAMISGANINIDQGNNIISDGAIYAADNIDKLDQTNNMTINGTLMAGNDIISDHTNNIVFNEPGEDQIITEGFIISGGSFAARYSLEEYQEADDFI